MGWQLLFGQPNNNWYFGGTAGLTFSSTAGQPVPSLLLNSVMRADEGSATISNEQGELLFYTNGKTVYNREHEIMANGDDLDGDLSACQSSLIIPVPGNDSIYYVFTTDAIENDFVGGYRYSIVNINRDGGKGEVISKNNLLWSSCTERLTAARHGNGTDVWVITNDKNSNIFRAWLITCNGLSLSPVVSTLGVVMNMHVTTNTGFMKVSPDGKLLCQTHFPMFDPDVTNGNFFQLFDFNNLTGQLSNARTVGSGNVMFTACEFSPDSRLLYLSRPFQKKIDQFDITLLTASAIESSSISIPTLTAYPALQLGPDEKIYCFKREQSIGAINFPNTRGLNVGFNETQHILSPNSSIGGAPNCMNDVAYDPYNGINYTILDSCRGIVQFNGTSSMAGLLTWHWDFGDGQQSSQQNPLHTFNPSSNTFIVRMTVSSGPGCGTIRKTRVVQPKKYDPKISFDFVALCDSGYVRFINENLPKDPGDSFTWYFGDGQTATEDEPVHIYTIQGQYRVRLVRTNPSGCRNAEIIDTISYSQVPISLPPSQEIVIGQSIQLYVNGSVASCLWTPGALVNNPTSRYPLATPVSDTYFRVVVTDEDGCQTEDSVLIKVVDIDDVYVPTGFTPNNDGRNDDLRPYFGTKYILNEFAVFNRWGEKIYSTRSRGTGWNGKRGNLEQPSGVYVWTISVTDSVRDKKIERQGTVVLVR
jgi:gliding motility-associated-like protein